jgi:hypothetical protein
MKTYRKQSCGRQGDAPSVVCHQSCAPRKQFAGGALLTKGRCWPRSSEVLAPSMAEAKELASHSAGQSQALQKSFQNGHINERPLAPY